MYMFVSYLFLDSQDPSKSQRHQRKNVIFNVKIMYIIIYNYLNLIFLSVENRVLPPNR